MSRRLLHPVDELERLSARSTAVLADLIQRYMRSKLNRTTTQEEKLFRALARQMGESMCLADLLGRRRLILEARAKLSRQKHYAANIPVIVPVPFEEALADLISREPMLAEEDIFGRPRYQVVQDLYINHHAFSMAKSLDLTLTRKVQDLIGESLFRGTNPVKAIEDAGDWSHAYAETVYRTNLTGCYAAGRLQQAMDSEISKVIGGLRFTAVGDSDTRPNHAAADGFIAHAASPVWRRLSPPLGYNCRCGLEMVDVFELEDLGLYDAAGRIKEPSIPPGAGRDKNFRGGRPDEAIYGRTP